MKQIYFVFCLMLGLAQSGFCSIQVFPTRIFLSDENRIARVILRHLGSKPGQYKISTVFYRMKPDGSIAEAKDVTDAERPLTRKMLRFSPRASTIPPNQEQVVRVIYAGPKNLPDGDYRIHLHFEPGSENETEGTLGSFAQGKINMKLEARLAIAIPVIYRHGNPKYQINLSDLKITKGPDQKPALSLKLSNTGNVFPYGDFKAEFFEKGKQAEIVAVAKGVANYLTERTVLIRLDIPEDRVLSNGILHLEFREPEETGGKLLGTSEISLP